MSSVYAIESVRIGANVIGTDVGYKSIEQPSYISPLVEPSAVRFA
jgi:hypothetical protein